MSFNEEFNLLREKNESFPEWFDRNFSFYNSKLDKLNQRVSCLPDGSIELYSRENGNTLFKVRSFMQISQHVTFIELFEKI
jgi:hypothetical protein